MQNLQNHVVGHLKKSPIAMSWWTRWEVMAPGWRDGMEGLDGYTCLKNFANFFYDTVCAIYKSNNTSEVNSIWQGLFFIPSPCPANETAI